MLSLLGMEKLNKRRLKKGRSTKKDIKKRAVKQSGIANYFTSSLNQVAPLEWLPEPYQSQMRAAKPIKVKIYRSRTKKKKIPLQ